MDDDLHKKAYSGEPIPEEFKDAPFSPFLSKEFRVLDWGEKFAEPEWARVRDAISLLFNLPSIFGEFAYPEPDPTAEATVAKREGKIVSDFVFSAIESGDFRALTDLGELLEIVVKGSQRETPSEPIFGSSKKEKRKAAAVSALRQIALFECRKPTKKELRELVEAHLDEVIEEQRWTEILRELGLSDFLPRNNDPSP